MTRKYKRDYYEIQKKIDGVDTHDPEATHDLLMEVKQLFIDTVIMLDDFQTLIDSEEYEHSFTVVDLEKFFDKYEVVF